MKKRRTLGGAMLMAVCLSLCLCTPAFADTDGTEPKITQQPDQLILQLGSRWAGVEFELRTDAGLFPVPIVVDESGVLTMDLGGSTTYTLSCINSTVPIPDPTVTEQPVDPAQPQPPAEGATQQDASAQPPATSSSRIPTGAVILFLGGLICAVGGLIVLHIAKRREQASYDEWDDEEE